MSITRSVSSAKTRNKLALVIGNNEYEARNHLQNPVNDATDMMDALERIGFDVEKCENGTYKEMEYWLNTFVNQIQSNDMVLFYFAGHGHQWEVSYTSLFL